MNNYNKNNVNNYKQYIIIYFTIPVFIGLNMAVDNTSFTLYILFVYIVHNVVKHYKHSQGDSTVDGSYQNLTLGDIM